MVIVIQKIDRGPTLSRVHKVQFFLNPSPLCLISHLIFLIRLTQILCTKENSNLRSLCTHRSYQVTWKLHILQSNHQYQYLLRKMHSLLLLITFNESLMIDSPETKAKNIHYTWIWVSWRHFLWIWCPTFTGRLWILVYVNTKRDHWGEWGQDQVGILESRHKRKGVWNQTLISIIIYNNTSLETDVSHPPSGT